MKLFSLGVDHHSAPTSVREALAFEGPRLAEGLSELRREFESAEFTILSTCNRVEVYAASDAAELLPPAGALAAFLARFHSYPADRLDPHLAHRYDEEVVRHLFRVSASLESVVLGEGQILGQVKGAYREAERLKALGPILHSLFNQAIHVGKKVRETTGIDQGRLSVASVAVDLARDVFDGFGDKTVLIVGAGKIGELTLRHISELSPGKVLVANRDLPKAEALALLYRGEAASLDRLFGLLIEADLVISTTASPQPIVTLEQYQRVQRARRNRLSLILDIAVPRDFDSRIGDLEQVLLYNVDDLKEQALANVKRRAKGIDPAERIIEHEVSKCLSALRRRRTMGVVLGKLGRYADEIRMRELEKVFASRPELNEDQRQAIAHFAVRLQNQFLHHPRTALKSAAEAEEEAELLSQAVLNLFRLDHPELSEDDPKNNHPARPQPKA